VHPDDGTVDHRNRFADALGVVERLKEQVPQPEQCPTPELAIDRLPFAKEIRQIAPMIARAPPAVGPTNRHEGFEKSPLLIARQSSDQARLPPKAILNQIFSTLKILFVNWA
jgi:hypothetical protein